MKNSLKLTISVVGCLLAGVVGGLFTASSIPTWYAHLVRPIFSPPNYLFGPVWTVLYILMGVSFYLIWSKKVTNASKSAMITFAIQLLLNAIWSPIFFGARNIFLALVVILVLWVFILKTILAFAKIDKIASYLLWPYLAWVSFASVLNFSIWFLNR